MPSLPEPPLPAPEFIALRRELLGLGLDLVHADGRYAVVGLDDGLVVHECRTVGAARQWLQRQERAAPQSLPSA